uniref:VWFA and cache domain-containing protein 1-like n=1 Tax=Saccoglossus kowalevskii TaxID=10224 RepID=A0ABM0MIN0_SACKO|nr:PREDICTED: VWFA and cache domain-containing protein 1-like [Saccoglossus kowalevskii]
MRESDLTPENIPQNNDKTCQSYCLKSVVIPKVSRSDVGTEVAVPVAVHDTPRPAVSQILVDPSTAERQISIVTALRLMTNNQPVSNLKSGMLDYLGDGRQFEDYLKPLTVVQQYTLEHCFVMDSSGHLVMHRDYIESDSDVNDIHITEKEPDVSEDLLRRDILKKRQCVDFQGLRNMDYYRMKLAVQQKVSSTIHALENIREAVEKSFVQSEIEFTPCCEMPDDMELNTAFGKAVNLSIGCIRIADNAEPNSGFLSYDVIDVMKNNYDSFSNLKWQYFGTDEGVLTIYPASLIDGCDNYDHRFRPWYVKAATPEPKNVVIVIDKSSPMTEVQSGKSLLNIAQNAAITVLKTLNLYDKVGVIAFSNNAVLLPVIGDSSCYANELALPTTANIENLKQFVQSLAATGEAYYEIAFDAAFNLLKASYILDNDTERDQVIIFMTKGEPFDEKSSVMQKIRSKNAEIGNKVVILPFAVGSESAITLLNDIANQHFEPYGVEEANISIGEIKPGFVTQLTDYNLPRSKMARFYDYFANYNKLTDGPMFSVPYQDRFGLGIVTTAAMPVITRQEQKGVVGVDITLTDLLEYVNSFTEGHNSYAFVFETDRLANGRTLIHPLLPSPSVIKKNVMYVHITSLEREQDFYDYVYMNATNDGSGGEATFTSKRYFSRGNQRTEGASTISVPSTYYWRRVIGSNYIVCFVETVGVHIVELLDRNFQASDQSTFQFAPRCFISPVEYLENEETESTAQQYLDYIKDASNVKTYFKKGVRDAVIVTAKVNEIWKSEEADIYNNYTLFRYMGTRNGVYRQLPGITMNKLHDTTARPWYEVAKNNVDKLVLSLPYTDENGAGEVIAMSKAITKNISSTATSSNVLAVMGMDFTMTYFYKLLIKHYPECGESKTSDDEPICLPQRPLISPIFKNTDVNTGLDKCYYANCDDKQSSRVNMRSVMIFALLFLLVIDISGVEQQLKEWDKQFENNNDNGGPLSSTVVQSIHELVKIMPSVVMC